MMAIEPTELIYIGKKDLIELYNHSPNFVSFGRKILEHLLIEQEKITSLLLTLKPKERYEKLLQDKPALFQSIPLQYIATFLGMKRETLSRIRGRKE